MRANPFGGDSGEDGDDTVTTLMYTETVHTSLTQATSKNSNSLYIKPYKISKDGKVIYDTLTVASTDLSNQSGSYTITANAFNVCSISNKGDKLSFVDSNSYDSLGVPFGEYTLSFDGEDGIRYYTTSNIDLGTYVNIEYVSLGVVDGQHLALVKSVQAV